MNRFVSVFGLFHAMGEYLLNNSIFRWGENKTFSTKTWRLRQNCHCHLFIFYKDIDWSFGRNLLSLLTILIEFFADSDCLKKRQITWCVYILKCAWFVKEEIISISKYWWQTAHVLWCDSRNFESSNSEDKSLSWYFRLYK